MLVFIDESGNHNLNYLHAKDPYNIFVLGALCISESEYKQLDHRLKLLKKELFNEEDIILHTVEITRPNKSKNILNDKFNNPDFRKRFYTEINLLIEATDFEIVTCLIRKSELWVQVGANAVDPYIYSLNLLLDRILMRCQDQNCKIYPEKRDNTENIKIELEFLRAKNAGTEQFSGADVSNKVEEFVLKDKKANISGLQLIDLIVTPIGRNFLGKKKKEAGHEVSYEVIQKKIATGDLIIYP